MMLRKEKLSIDEYFKLLQLEYLSYYFRSKIYEDPSFIKMCEDICEKKRVKILNITKTRPRLKSIFDDPILRKRMIVDEFLSPYGPPNFKYPPDRLGMIFYDNLYSFKPGFKVKTREGEFIIVNNFPDDNCVIVKVGNREKKMRYIDVELLVKHLFD